MLDSSQVRAGENASTKLYTLRTPRQSNAATADKIKADYSSLSDWATGMAVMEIVPGGEGIWHASIGQKQNVNYRVQLNADGSSCLLTATGNKLRDIQQPPTQKPEAAKPEAWSPEAGSADAGKSGRWRSSPSGCSRGRSSGPALRWVMG